MGLADELDVARHRVSTLGAATSGREVAGLGTPEADRRFEDFDAALRIDPENVQALVGRGLAWQAQGDHERSFRDFDEVVRLRPDDSQSLGYRATARHHLGDFTGAIADFDQAIGIAPQVAWLYNGRGTSLHANDDLQAAVAEYTRAIELDPEFAEPYRNRGMARSTEGDFEAAIPDYTEAIRLNSTDALAFDLRGGARSRIGELEAALADFDEAIRLDPKLARAYQGRAAVRYAMDLEDEAEADHDPPEEHPMILNERKVQIDTLIQSHFSPTPVADLTITEREFPHRVRADLQKAVDRVFAEGITVSYFCGVRKTHAFEGISFSELLIRDRNNPVQVVPPLYEEVNVGDEQPIRCLKNGLWLLESDGTKFAVFLEQGNPRFHQNPGVKVQVATPNDPQGFQTSQVFLKRLEEAIQKAESYRGKILSLEAGDQYSGKSSGITVHRLSTVDRDQVILPASTLELLERNVIRFVGLRSKLAGFGLATKKGLLFYGPPGTGKTHTIHYLAGALPGHTTLLITAEQVGLLGEYMALARLLQPSIVVIEDVDLIARDRTEMGSPCEEAMLNKLLNEMDGLRPDSEILFLLTTNRPETLEAALASRPGRVDQAIEFPLPDDDGRNKLVRLYARGAELPEEVVQVTVKRTEGVSASFIKELMRRSMQFHLERSDTGSLTIEDVEAALDELLFSGGSLNRKLLGGRVE
jgi:Tfp pilus assembly protein PilF